MTEFLAQHRAKLDIAYGCHVFAGILHAIVTLAFLVDFTSGQVIGMLSIPLAVLAGVGLVVAGVLTVRLWRHWPLVLLMFLLLAPVVAYGPLRAATGLRQDVLLLGYDLAAVVLAARWFLLARPAVGGSGPNRKP